MPSFRKHSRTKRRAGLAGREGGRGEGGGGKGGEEGGVGGGEGGLNVLCMFVAQAAKRGSEGSKHSRFGVPVVRNVGRGGEGDAWCECPGSTGGGCLADAVLVPLRPQGGLHTLQNGSPRSHVRYGGRSAHLSWGGVIAGSIQNPQF